MYQQYPFSQFMSQSERLDMWYRMANMYPLYYQIYDWLHM